MMKADSDIYKELCKKEKISVDDKIYKALEASRYNIILLDNILVLFLCTIVNFQSDKQSYSVYLLGLTVQAVMHKYKTRSALMTR